MSSNAPDCPLSSCWRRTATGGDPLCPCSHPPKSTRSILCPPVALILVAEDGDKPWTFPLALRLPWLNSTYNLVGRVNYSKTSQHYTCRVHFPGDNAVFEYDDLASGISRQIASHVSLDQSFGSSASPTYSATYLLTGTTTSQEAIFEDRIKYINENFGIIIDNSMDPNGWPRLSLCNQTFRQLAEQDIREWTAPSPLVCKVEYADHGTRAVTQRPRPKPRFQQLSVTFSTDTHFEPSLSDPIPKSQPSPRTNPLPSIPVNHPNTRSHSKTKVTNREAQIPVIPSRGSERVTASKDGSKASSGVADVYDCTCGFRGSSSISTHPVPFKFSVKCTKCGRLSHNTCARRRKPNAKSKFVCHRCSPNHGRVRQPSKRTKITTVVRQLSPSSESDNDDDDAGEKQWLHIRDGLSGLTIDYDEEERRLKEERIQQLLSHNISR